MPTLDGFVMESNVARDVLSTASSFGSLPKVVAEYVTNSIDAREEGQSVNVTISKRRSYGGGKRLVISDDASGMDDRDLRRFFFMHAENEARRRGRSARGRFGTGKAAAFGIGSSLQVETRKNGRKWVVRLDKTELQAAVAENRKPRPDVRVDGEPTKEQNGTEIIIDGISRNIDQPRIAKELRRRLGRQLDVHSVSLFNSRVHTVEPRAVREWGPFKSADDKVAAVIGNDVVCMIKAAPTAVDDAIQGVIVTSNDFPVAQIDATGDYAARIFGHCDVPALERDDSTPGPYTDARDLTLNEDNKTAGPLAEWLRSCLNKVVSDLAAEERERRRRARDEALQNAASRMEAVLNRHFQGEFRRSRVRGDAGTRVISVTGDPEGELVQPNRDGFSGYEIPETDQPSVEDSGKQTPDQSSTQEESTTQPDSPTEPGVGSLHDRDPFGEGRGDAVSATEERPRRKRRGGFKIDWEHAGEEAPRSNYIESELTILINLDHPEMAAAYTEGDSSPLFRMLVFEAAAQEYAYATAYQQLEEDSSMDGSDTVQYVRATIDHLTRDVAEVVADLAWMPTPAAIGG